MYRVAFGITATELYRQHGAPRGKRDFLPLVVQRIIQIHEIVNAEKLRNQTLPEAITGQTEINSHIVLIVKRQTEHTEIYLATFRLFGKGAQLGQKKPSLKTQPSITVTTEEYGPIECEVLEVENDADIPF